MSITITTPMVAKVDIKVLKLTNDSVFYKHVSESIFCSDVRSFGSKFSQLRSFCRTGIFTGTCNVLLTITLWDHYAEEFNLPRIQSNSVLRPSNFSSAYDWDRGIREYLRECSRKPVNQPVTKFTVGSKVILKNTGGIYPTYEGWIKKNGINECQWISGEASLDDNTHYTILKIAPHEAGSITQLAFIVNEEGRGYIIDCNEKCLQLVTPNVNPCQEIALETGKVGTLKFKYTGEKQMKTLTKYQGTLITSVTLLNGIDVSELTEADFITKIQGIQSEIKGYDGLPKSTHVSSRVKQLKEDLDAVVKLMDETLGAESK